MNDQQVMHAMYIDDSYETQRVLADAVGGRTELVTFEGAGPFVRKKIPVELARRRVWSTLAECACKRLPQVELTYELPDQFVVVYDFVPGRTLEHVVKDGSAAKMRSDADADEPAEDQREAHPLGLDMAIGLACDVCEAAQALHEHGIVHRDISPANIVVAGDGAHLIDLGIARMRVEGASRDTASLGTWGFASPEQYGFAQTDARSDVYSIGRVLGFSLTGVTPGDQAYDIALQDSTLVPLKVRAAIEQACAFEPSSRYQSASEFASALRKAVQPCAAAEADCEAERLESENEVRTYPRVGEDGFGGRKNTASKQSESAQYRSSSYAGQTPLPETAAQRERPRRLLIGAVAAAAIVAVCCVAAAAVLSPDAQRAGNPESRVAASGTSAGDAEGGSSRVSSDSEPSFAAAPASSAQDASSLLEVVESGWSCDPTGYVHYALALRNSSDVAIEFPTVRIVGRAQDGAVLFSDEKPLMVIDAQRTVLYGSQAGNGEAPATVEFEALEPREYNIGSRTNVPEYVVSGVAESSDRYGGTTFTGTVEMTSGQAEDDMVAISVVLRDAAGSIVAGYNGFVTCGKVGEKATFEVLAQNAPEHASFEVSAQQW